MKVIKNFFERRGYEAACVHEEVATADSECPLYTHQTDKGKEVG